MDYKGLPFSRGGLTQQAGGCSSVELSRGGNLFSRGGDPSSSYLHRGFLLGGQSGAGQQGDNHDMDSTRSDPTASCREVTGEGEHYGICFERKCKLEIYVALHAVKDNVFYVVMRRCLEYCYFLIFVIFVFASENKENMTPV